MESNGFGRRGALKAATAIAAGLAAPAVHAQGPVTLRYVGTAVNQSNEIKAKVKDDLGIIIEYVPVTSDDVVRRAVTQPNSLDILDAEYWMLKKIVPSGNLAGMDVKRIKLAEEITPVFTKGEVGGRKIGDQGTAPRKVMYLPAREAKAFAPRQRCQWMYCWSSVSGTTSRLLTMTRPCLNSSMRLPPWMFAPRSRSLISLS